MPTISLKWPLILACILAVLGALAGASTQFSDMGLPPAEVKAVLALFTLLLAIGNAVQGVLIAFGMTSAARIAAVKELPLETRASSLASDPQVTKVVLKEQAVADASGDKVVGPSGH